MAAAGGADLLGDEVRLLLQGEVPGAVLSLCMERALGNPE
jgi:hypothetical protein